MIEGEPAADNGGAPRLSIIIVTYQARDFIARCIDSLPHDPSVEILLWDNDGRDGTVGFVRRAYPHVHVIESAENLGFSRANNACFSRCRAPYILMLNPDAIVSSAHLPFQLAAQLDADPTIAMVGPRLHNVDGSHQVGDCGWRASTLTLASHFLFLHKLFPAWPALYLSNRSLARRASLDVDWICGACLMFRRTLLAEIGGLDEHIFMYGEDMDWGARARDRGHRVVYLPQLAVTHLQGATQRTARTAFVSTKWIDALEDSFIRARPWPHRLILKAVMVAGFLLRSVLYAAGAVLRRDVAAFTRAAAMLAYAKHCVHPRRPRDNR